MGGYCTKTKKKHTVAEVLLAAHPFFSAPGIRYASVGGAPEAQFADVRIIHRQIVYERVAANVPDSY